MSVTGQQDTSTTDNEYNMLSFVFWMLMQKVQTATLVEVVSCTNAGGLSPVGRVTVQPCVNQMTGNRQAVAHGQIFNCLYSRMSGGGNSGGQANAIIMDPKKGDLGLMVFCSRDISGVVANEGPANPGSFRMFDWADGVFTANVPLGVTPTQYIRFDDTDGIEIVSPVKIRLQAPVVEIDAATEFKVVTETADIEASTEFEVNTATVAIASTGNATMSAAGTATVSGASAALEATGTATVQGAQIDLAGPISQTTGGTASLEAVTATSVDAPTITSSGTNLHTHDHGPGTYNVSGSPVTGNSSPP